MKFLVVLAVICAVATAEHAAPQNERLLNIIGAIINHLRPPIAVGPAIVEDSPISVGPAIIEDSPISVGPAIVEDSPISVGPAIIDDSIIIEEVKPTPVSPFPVIPDISSLTSPLVQVIVNVNSDSVSGNPVIVEGPKPSPSEIKPTPVIVVEKPEIKPTPVIVVEKPEIKPTPVIVVEKPEIKPTPVIVVEQPEIKPTPVIVVENPEPKPEPVLIAPIEVAPVMVLPDILN